MQDSRRGFLKATGASIALAVTPSLFAMNSASSPKKPQQQPNILYLHTHDIGRYCQPYGYPVSTPNMQQLAEEGVLFHHCFSAAPTCSPGRASLLTGELPHNNGMLGLAHRGFKLFHNYKHHIVHTLRKVGYHSALIGHQHVAKKPEWIGYDELVDYNSEKVKEQITNNNLRRDLKVTAAAEKWLKNPPKQPFFLSVGYLVTHREYLDPDSHENPNYCRPPAPLPNIPETRRDMAAFKASARALDQMYGRILTALKENGLDKNTLVICTAEHGLPSPSMKCNLTDHGAGVMLIMRGPSGFTGGKVCDALISQLDVFPTVCELAGVKKPDWLQGKSFMPIIRGKAEEVNEEVFGEVNYHAAYEPMRSVRTKRWSYIRRFDGRKKPVLSNCDDSLSKDIWLKHDWQNKNIPEEQLYDLIFDPIEVNNLAYNSDPKMQEVLKQMRSRLENNMKKTEDPLLKGHIKIEPDYLYNDPNDISPRAKFYYKGPNKEKVISPSWKKHNEKH